MATAETESPRPAQVDKSASSSKRKANVEEIEVDVNAPEPPSKRARRALKKGKPLPAKPSSDGEKEDKEGQKDGREKTRSEHGVWIGNLPFRLTAAELRTWLIDNAGGVITEDAMTRVKLPTVKDANRRKDEKPANRGFAYVDFADIGGKVAAIALSETELSGRKLLIKDAKSFEGRPAKEKEPEEAAGKSDATTSARSKTEQRQETNASRKVFVGNLSFKTTEEDLIRNFEKCGEIEWAKLATFEDSGKCKGYGWVKFKEPEAAAWAVRGFVKIKEEVETEEDFRDDKSGSEAEDEEKSKQKQLKTRKWWVNRMLGRELKLELAEDDQARYKKRFGKDAPRKADDTSRPPRRSRADEGGDGRGGKQEAAPPRAAPDIAVARLTGGLVQHTGTKVTFD
ncbi:rna binding rnp24 [Trichoderma cornu-damae]|uniref:Rna binding rnp24 n=1 Tax=Trichoderma cornu-damae TaxID=654480 RepID=A0A9P8QVN0_9HYPO|nr:rna binding rnp24 [Trichoderma cornu-damae]